MPLIAADVDQKATQSANDPTAFWSNLLAGKKVGDVKKDLPPNHRVIEEDGVATADFVQGRFNLHVDKDGKVKKVTHG